MISPDEWRRLEPLLDAVLDAPPAARRALVEQLSGGDTGLRVELERMLAGAGAEHALLGRPAAESFAALLDAAAPFPPVLAERYRVEGELGRGGMATVFLARDLKHGRDVAVKVVNPLLVAAAGRERFLREIGIVARLRHPHIVPLFDSGEADGSLFYVMPYEEGHSLRERLTRDGPFPIDDAVRILREVCDALAHAHAHGIVHRDIKPDNVLLSGRHATVTDFGVATAVSDGAADGGDATRGVVIGTPAYMAPEQVTGDPAIDHRADLYAFGVLAYELLTGAPPFDGPTRAAVLEAHLNTPPPPAETVRPEVPPALASLVMRCLEKRPDDRWQRAEDVLRALADVEVAAPTRRRRAARLVPTLAVVTGLLIVVVLATRPRQPAAPGRGVSRPTLSLAILPVTAAAPGGELDWLSHGLERRLSAELTPVSGLDLRPTESLAASLGARMPLDSVALVHDVDYFVKASLARGKHDSVVVTLELIELGLRSVRAGGVRALLRTDDAVEVIGRQVAEQLQPMLGARIRERQLEEGTSNVAALEHRRRADRHRLLARQLLGAGDLAGVTRALDSATASLLESQRLDPAWDAPRIARATLSRLRAQVILFTDTATDRARLRAAFDAGIAIADSALARQPQHALALATRGRLRWQRIVLGGPATPAGVAATDTAQRDLEAAIALDSTLAQAAADLSQLMFEARGDFVAAAAYAERAQRLDAYMEEASQIINLLARSKLEIGEEASADRWCSEGVRRFPQNPAHYACHLEVLAWGNGDAPPAAVWGWYGEVERHRGALNVEARVHYLMAVAAALARAGAVPPDSSWAVMMQAAVAAAGPGATPALNDELLALEAAVLFRLGVGALATARFDAYRLRAPQRAALLQRRRMLRGYLPADSATAGRS